MAIIVDPDLLNRNEIIFGTFNQEISANPVGAVVDANYDPEPTDGATTSTFTFGSAGSTFQADGVAIGDILSIKTGQDAGHWRITAIASEVSLTVESIDDGDFGAPTDWADTAGTGLVFDIRDPNTGNMIDGATEQAIYSFSKEEWRVDGETFGSDDLIRHEFPFEPLTREQFEIGGGTPHDLWDWFANDTKERVRTGGWDSVDDSSVKQSTYTGVVTLGPLQTDAQVYYQPSGVDADPTDIILQGVVNQAVLVHDVAGAFQPVVGFDTRTFFKLFIRKKAFTYAGSEISDIGVVTLENIVNRFPLTHVADPAIVATDAEVEGHDPYTNFTILETDTDGVTADVDTITGTLTSAGAAFDTTTLAVGDVVEITGGTNDNGFFIITNIAATVLTLDTVEHGAFSGESTLTYETHTRIIVRSRTNDGTIIETAAASGNLTSLVGGFAASGVAIADILRITEPGASGLEGVFKIIDIVSDSNLGINTSDQAFPAGAADVIDYEVLEPGMYLQSKADDIPVVGLTTLAFADANPDTITRVGGSWITDGILAGDKITIAGSVSNDDDYVVRSFTATVITLDALDTLVAEGAVAATATITRHFTRDINGDDFPFLWRCFGNNATASKVYEFIQRQLRRTTDIDNGFDRDNFPGRGDVTDLLMTFANPTGKGLNMFIDDLDANDTNNVTFVDAVDATRAFSFVSAGTIVHNQNLIDDSDAVVRMFFTTNPGGNFGTENAILVEDATSTPISYSVSATSSRSFTFDYDNNVQGGRSSGADAAVTIVAIGLNNAQYVLFEGTITRATGLTFSLVSALERNYSNP